jgi:hypothetical protein
MSEIATIKQFLETHIERLRSHGVNHCGINGYFCIMDFILQHGRVWNPGTICWGKGKMNCFRHASKAALRNRDYTYVEGYASLLIPVHHAWLLDRNGAVIETTWPHMGSAYYGIPFRADWVRMQQRESDHLSIIDQWTTDWKTMRTPKEQWLRSKL